MSKKSKQNRIPAALKGTPLEAMVKGAKPQDTAELTPEQIAAVQQSLTQKSDREGIPLNGAPGAWRRPVPEETLSFMAEKAPDGFNPLFSYLARRDAIMKREKGLTTVKDPEQRPPSVPTPGGVMEWYATHNVPAFITKWWRTQATLGFPSKHTYAPVDVEYLEAFAQEQISNEEWVGAWLPFFNTVGKPISAGVVAQYILSEALHLGLVAAAFRYTTGDDTSDGEIATDEIAPLIEDDE